MTRYTDTLKEKVICVVCDRIISKGHIKNHLVSKIHNKNLKQREKTDEKDEINADKSITITWD